MAEEKLRQLKWYKKLQTKKHRDEEKCFFIEGEKKIQQISLRAPELIDEILLVDGEEFDLGGDFAVRTVTKGQFASISRHKSPQSMGAVIRKPQSIEWEDFLGSAKKILFLSDVQDPGNIGTLVRTAAAFDFDGIILSEKCADVFSPKVVDASVGSLFSLWHKQVKDVSITLQNLKDNGFEIAVADLTDTSENERLSASHKLVLVLGSEGQGVGNDVLQMADFKVTIDINRDKAESLNVAVCGALMMYLACGKK